MTNVTELTASLAEHGLGIEHDVYSLDDALGWNHLCRIIELYDDPSVGIFGWKDERWCESYDELAEHWAANREAILAAAYPEEEVTDA